MYTIYDIKEFLSDKSHKLILLDKIDSTNNYAKALAGNSEQHGTVVIAKSQTNGKGRLGRSFCSPKSTGIYMSIIVRPTCDIEKVSLLTSCMAVAASRAIDRLYNTNIKIKWVNDLFLNDRKICGILTEGSLNTAKNCNYAIVGIGVNVKSVKKCFPSELLEIASSLEDETEKTVPTEQIIAYIINEFDTLLPDFENGNFIDEYRNRSCIIGADVLISKSGREKTAKAVGISDNAGLIVRYSDGTEETLTSGEARIKKS